MFGISLKDDKNAVRLLIRARQTIAAAIKESGGCDHKVGVCACADIKTIHEIDERLFAEFGVEMVWQFFWAEPTHTQDNREPGLKWAQDARQTIIELVNLKMLDVANPEE